MTERGYRPWELEELTLSEVALLCEQKGEEITSGASLRSESDLQHYVQWWASLTPLARLHAGRQELGLG